MGHLRANGFGIDSRDLADSKLRDIKIKYRITDKLISCHTAVVDGYVFEGHVPADLIQRVLKEKPAIAGLAVPGMPIGSPGMEGPNPERYDVLSFTRDGKVSVYARR